MPRLRALAVAGCLHAAAPAGAVNPAAGPRVAADTLTAMPDAGLAKPLRTHRTYAYAQAAPSAAWAAFVSRAGGTWNAAWDVATGVPTRIWGSGIPAPGAVADPAIAEQFARRVLTDHLALLAPGASIGDFVLASNSYDGNIRSVGFFQLAGAHRVVGGQVSFEFKHDRLFVIGSEALPNVGFAVPQARANAAAVRAHATTRLRQLVQLPAAPVTSLGADVVLPLVSDAGVLGYRLVSPLEIDGGAGGRYLAYADVATGGIVALRQENLYATGTVQYLGVDRYPARGRVDRPAPRAHVTINAQPVTTGSDGSVSWSPDATAPLTTAIAGDYVAVVNKADMPETAQATLQISPGGSVVWDASASTVAQADGTADHQDDAQVNAYLDVNIAKQFVRDHLDPQMPTIDDPLTVNVNLDQSCNAFFDGTSLNFFHATAKDSGGCQNTALIQDVGFHEFGHDVHASEVIPGVGVFDAAMSEGAADFLACSITGDSGMGRGFFYNDTPLRELDPPDMEYRWPDDVGEVHHTGLIFGGTFWDLRKAAIAQLGQDAGVALTLQLYLGALRRSIDIPSSLIEVLAADDDDGDLSNGTPHECLIRAAYGRHGLRTASGTVEAPGTLDQLTRTIGVAIHIDGLSSCGEDDVTGATLDWKPPYTGVPAAGKTTATLAGLDVFDAELPLSPQESVFYRAHVNFSDGSSFALPDNVADPYYQLYDGPTVKLYCTDFESGDPLTQGWTTGTADGSPSPWQWGVPTSGATDPHAAYSGTHVLALALNGDYKPNQYSWVKTPVIDIGHYSDVRVQYRRWLAVEDGQFDKARVTANDQLAWINSSENSGDNSAHHHIDKEWRFADVALSGYFRGRTLQVGWDLRSDGGLEFGGWTIDDVCIVANPNSICGDGVKTATEQCDDGAANADVPDACRTDCRAPTCGDRIVDSGEQCDDGSAGSPACTTKCKIIQAKVGGCAAGGGPAGPVSLALITLLGGVGLARRRARA